MPRDVDTRTITLVDLPLIRRLSEKAIVLDSELEFTRENYGQNGALLSNIILPQRGIHTLVARSDKQQVVGQFRLRADNHNAHITYIAPNLEADNEDTVWLRVLEAMSREAGKHNAHMLMAEVNEDEDLFETMRTAGFAVYARQRIWRRLPGDYDFAGRAVSLTDITEVDLPAIHALMTLAVPPLMQQIVELPAEPTGWVFRREHSIDAFFSVTEGKNGVYIQPYLRPTLGTVDDLMSGVMRNLTNANTIPVYICVRRYQDWISHTLEGLGFEPGPRQAVMVKHISARVRQAKFKAVPNGLLAGSANHPTGPLKG